MEAVSTNRAAKQVRSVIGNLPGGRPRVPAARYFLSGGCDLYVAEGARTVPPATVVPQLMTVIAPIAIAASNITITVPTVHFSETRWLSP